MSYPRFIRSRSSVKARRTAGNLTLNSTAWSNVDTGLDLTLNECQVGDEIVYGISALAGTENANVTLDVVTLVASTATNSFAERGPAVASPGKRLSGTYLAANINAAVNGPVPPYTVVAGDLTNGQITLRLRYATATAAARTLYASADFPLDVWAWNIGPGAQP